MAGDGPALSAFAARKRLLARITEPRSSVAAEDENSGSAGAGAAGAGPSSSDSAGNANQSKRTSGRRKRQRVEKTPGKEREPEVTVQAGTTGEATPGRRSRSTPKPGATDEPSQPPAEAPAATSLEPGTAVIEEARSCDSLSSVSREPGAGSETPARHQSALTILAQKPLSGPSPPFVAKEIIRDGITKKGKGVIELHVDQVDRLRLPIVGQYGVRVIHGEASIAGATLHPSSEVTWIRCSLCYSSPLLRCPEGSVLELHQHPASDGLKSLGRLSPLFRGIWNRTRQENGAGAPGYQILCGPEDLPKKSVFRPLHSPPEWNKKLSELADMIKLAPILVCGPKGSGKSTFSRFLTNRLLTQPRPPQKSKTREIQRGVVLLDLDPGQPEFCPAGMVSLVLVQKPNISPPFAHPWPHDDSETLIRCHSLASVTPGSNPDLFMECVLDLYNQYQKGWNGYPLVVNSPGWVLGTGLDLLSSVIARIRPREVVYMSEDGPAETVDGLQAACKRTSSFSTLPSQQSDSGARKTAAQLRAMQTMAYFHTRVEAKTSHVLWNSSPLSAASPWKVKYAGTSRGFVGIMCYGDQPTSALLAEAINGMVLAAVEIEDERAFRKRVSDDVSMDVDVSQKRIIDSLDELICRTPEGIPYFEQCEGETLDPSYSRSIGLVLVRGVDVEGAALQILTPISQSTLQEIRQNGRHVVLVHGQFDAPTWAYTEDLYEKEFSGGEDEEDESDEEASAATGPSRPWVEGVAEGRRKQAVAGTWRVRRDLGKQNRGG